MKLTMAIYREVIDKLNKAKENRPLSAGERKLIRDLQLRILGLAAIEKCRAKPKI
jgi:RNA polymerase-interacting CarD/CdnL/TRCF family regulator